MQEISCLTQDILKNLFKWKGRLSRKGYWYARILGFAANRLMKILLVMSSTFHSNVFLFIFLIWRVVLWFIFLFAAIRRYHDINKPGWLALILDGVGRLLAAASFGLFFVIFLLFGLGAPTENVQPMLLCFLLSCAASGVFCIANIRFLLRRSDPDENAYGNP